MSIRIGISPIAWQNDDLPDLTAAFTMDQALREAREIGYTGVERGQRMPSDTEMLRAKLDETGLVLCGGWCSGNLLTRDVADEAHAIAGQVAQFAALGAPCIVYAECSNTVQGAIGTPVSARPRLKRDEMRAYAEKLGELAKRVSDMGQPLAYHHHMGTIVESEEEIDWLMEASAPEVHLLYDTGHLWFGGGDVMRVLDRWGDRVLHVHFKDVRARVVRDARAKDKSFLDAVIAGAFTVPGDPDGEIDFQPITNRLASLGYDGWIVVEAEQDPAKAPPYAYSKLGYDHIVKICSLSGLTVAC